MFKKLIWNGKGININGEFLNHLRFADDIVLMAASIEEIETMLLELNEESQKIGLRMNMSKTKIMTNIDGAGSIKIGDEEVEIVTAEIRRRIGLGWAAFANYDTSLRAK